MTRRLAAILPLLLLAGIIAQIFALVAVVILWIPAVIWPQLLDSPFKLFTRQFMRGMVRGMVGGKSRDTVA